MGDEEYIEQLEKELDQLWEWYKEAKLDIAMLAEFIHSNGFSRDELSEWLYGKKPESIRRF